MTARKKQTPAARQRSGAQESFLDQPANDIKLPPPGSHCAVIGFALLAAPKADAAPSLQEVQ